MSSCLAVSSRSPWAPSLVIARAALVASAAMGCGDRSETAALGGEVAARVAGTVSIRADLVGQTAVAARVSREEALARLIGDAVGATEALETGVAERPAVRARMRAALAREVVRRMHEGARAGGPPTAEEVAALTAEAWVELDRPEMRVSVHLVVHRPKHPDDAALANARALAEQLRVKVGAAKTPEEFLTLAQQTSGGELQITAERLEGVAKDGRLPGGGTFDLAFVRALFALQKPGELSAVSESSFGFHVIRLVEIVPAYQMPLEQRRTVFADEVVSRRARRALDELLVNAQQTRGVSVSPAAAAMLGELSWR